jgi:hypothetical protein
MVNYYCRRFLILTLPVATLLILSLGHMHAGEPDHSAAMAAAESWLKLIDATEYTAAWQQASPLFKEQVPLKEWLTLIASAREPLGAVSSRELILAKRVKDLPGAPPGTFTVIQFKTRFATKPNSVETISPKLNSDGSWNVAGYFIK